MATCVFVKPDNSLIASADSVQSCNGYLLLSPQEVASMQSVFVPLSVTDGLAISTAILGLWASAWLWATISNFIYSPSGDNS